MTLSNGHDPKLGPDKQKYYRLLESEGVNAALTALHKEMWELEFETFEGNKGYQPQLFETLKKYREFSLELWDTKLAPGFKG
jgi:hypothetical protein